MKINNAHLTYCTNIHAGESWAEHFAALKESFPKIKSQLSSTQPMGMGLRLSNQASIEILQGNNLHLFSQWLLDNDAYVFTMNGFPYGSFHDSVVKDKVHTPDWTTNERLAYTLRLFDILTTLLPEGTDGGISTSPLSYKHWFSTQPELEQAKLAATQNILIVAEELHHIHEQTGAVMHLDIEPEPDGLLETGREFIDWYEQVLLPLGKTYFSKKRNLSNHDAETLIKRHVTLCYDVCHFAIGYEPHLTMVNELAEKGIQTGKIQISAALKAVFTNDNSNRQAILQELTQFNEPTYLHQVIARLTHGQLVHYPDLSDALLSHDNAAEWRAHFHVPIFLADFGLLQSTQADINEVFDIWKISPFTSHLEVETYTWGVLPQELKSPIVQSISRELAWVKNKLTT